MQGCRGFLGKRNDSEETEFVTSFERFLELQNNPDVLITRTVIDDDEKTLLVTFKSLKEEACKNGNIVLAVLTTAYARMQLYKVGRLLRQAWAGNRWFGGDRRVPR